MADAADVKQLLLQIDANTQLLRSNLSQAEREIADFQRKAEGSVAKTDRAFDSLGGSLKSLGAAMGPIKTAFAGLAAGIIGVGIAGAARNYLSLADQAKEMSTQLKLATADFGSFAQAQQDVQRIAAATRNGLAPTADLYATFARNSAELGRNQQDAARATETFAKALKIGGAGAAEAASATLQFSQALASGVLRGDEFNSIAEASPRILKLLADSLDVPVGKLRQMAAEGKLTADVLYTALTDRKFTAGIDAEFKQLPTTFDEAMTAVHDAAVTAFGAFDRGGDFSSMISNFVTDGTHGFSSLTDSAEEFGIKARAQFDALGVAIHGAIGIVEELKNVLASVDGTMGGWPQKLAYYANYLNGPTLVGRMLTGNSVWQSSARKSEADQRRRLAGADLEAASSPVMRRLGAMFGTYDINTPLTADNLFPKATAFPQASSSTGGRRVIGRGRAAVDDLSKAMDEVLLKASNMDVELAKIGYGNADKIANDRAHSFYASLGIDPQGDLDALIKQIDETRDRQVQASQEVADDFQRRQSAAIRDVGNLYYDLFTGGTKSLWDDFKRMGFDAVAQVLAKWTVTKLFPGSGGSLTAGIGSLLGFADGGMIGGSGGPRSDSVLARVSPGEFIVNADATRKALPLLQAINDNRLPRFADGGLVTPALRLPRLPDIRGMGAQSGGPVVNQSFDLRGAVVTEKLYQDMQAMADQAAVRGAAGGAAMAQERIARAAGRRLGR